MVATYQWKQLKNAAKSSPWYTIKIQVRQKIRWMMYEMKTKLSLKRWCCYRDDSINRNLRTVERFPKFFKKLISASLIQNKLIEFQASRNTKSRHRHHKSKFNIHSIQIKSVMSNKIRITNSPVPSQSLPQTICIHGHYL